MARIAHKALVCGASGFLGAALCRRLTREGVELHGLSRVPRSTHEGMRWWQADLTEPESIIELFSHLRPDVVFNVAGLSDGRPDRDRVLPLFLGNALSSISLLSAAAEFGCRRFIQSASLQEPDLGAAAAQPASPYALSKWVVSAYVDLFNRLYQLPTVILHLGIVYGPGEESAQRLIPYVITSLLKGESPRLSSGHQPVDWLYLEDAVDALMSAMQSPGAEGQSFNVGSGTATSVRTVAEQIAKTIDNGVAPVFGAVPDRPLVSTRQADPSRLLRELGWLPRTPLADGLRATVEWYRGRP
jgi:UDP-glucose 4-epimerase